jgi:hypothetical protein
MPGWAPRAAARGWPARRIPSLGWTGVGDGAPSADRLAMVAVGLARLSPSPRACSEMVVGRRSGELWAHRSAVAHQVAGRSVHAHRLLADRSDGRNVGSCQSLPALTLGTPRRSSMGDGASLPSVHARVRGRWTQSLLVLRPVTSRCTAARPAMDAIGPRGVFWAGHRPQGSHVGLLPLVAQADLIADLARGAMSGVGRLPALA